MTDAATAHRPLRAAIIGTGAIAHAHAQALADLAPRITLAAVVDVDADRAAAFAERFGAVAVYPDAAALLAAEPLDLVHICTPPQTHVPLAIAALRAGVPALIEKPTALSLAEMDELVAVSRETGVPALTVFQHRFGGAARRLQALAAEGALGRPLVATCETLWHRTPDYFDLPWRGRWQIEGGGPTMGHGIHQFDLLLAVLGPWARLTAFAARQALPTDTEDVSMALVEFENGALATVVNSIVSPRETSRLRFDFEYATVEVEHLYGYTDADWTFTPAPGHEHLAEQWTQDPAEPISSHASQLAAIVDALEIGAAPGVDADDARRTLELAAATYASAFRGVPVRAGEIAGDDPFLRSMDGGAVPWAPIKPALETTR
ncbi:MULTISPECIES: Gfo/Idh/MocA family oxidoreductase [unclassified Microbacterium]|uniref:Gfo/Idh/MocA family protein n=1 Tax=unclassified Microbacterium TaxID=2609290 RepID=UPI00214BD8F3|nr:MULTISPECIES: Gfo/Idh/MocA family oxidoreductase [unclassified Microbacterium]MCR2783472.1 Gfo/Idh/MocA family oxidoreductase [Microbacterium sp. zg.B96]WIM15665.1 Gfo/Idh/MocA family oxidoreductase [Microbacterium sp. zg-B96]